MMAKVNATLMLVFYFSFFLLFFFLTMPWRARILAAVNHVAPWISLRRTVFSGGGLHIQKCSLVSVLTVTLSLFGRTLHNCEEMFNKKRE